MDEAVGSGNYFHSPPITQTADGQHQEELVLAQSEIQRANGNIHLIQDTAENMQGHDNDVHPPPPRATQRNNTGRGGRGNRGRGAQTANRARQTGVQKHHNLHDGILPDYDSLPNNRIFHSTYSTWPPVKIPRVDGQSLRTHTNPPLSMKQNLEALILTKGRS